MARRFEGLTRALGGISLASVAYGEIGSSLIFALGIVALYAVGLTPWVLLAVGLLVLTVTLSYAEGASAMPAIFGPKGDQDTTVRDDVQRWYSHHFALTGGDEMHLDPSGLYNKPIKYRTWFQVAVHEIG